MMQIQMKLVSKSEYTFNTFGRGCDFVFWSFTFILNRYQ